MNLRLQKYHGIGNDYLVFDPNRNEGALSEIQIQKICNRNFGVGSDGILIGPIWNDNKLSVRIMNPDGSEAEKSGNGIRIFAKYLKDSGYIQKKEFVLSTKGGDVRITYLNERGTRLRAYMGDISFSSGQIPVKGEEREVIEEEMEFGGKTYHVTCASIGNPHCVIPLPSISKDLVCELGPLVEGDERFPNRINLQLLEVMDESNIKIEIYERGAGYTLASGSSSCAAACVAYRLGLTKKRMTVHMPGGCLDIEIEDDKSVYMTGPVAAVGDIVLSTEFLEELY
ncbi:MAG: diaminopimelate epimerase [Clostridiales bacterium]|nr:diaminopimelate epimerase [Clostridiales bacterium]